MTTKSFYTGGNTHRTLMWDPWGMSAEDGGRDGSYRTTSQGRQGSRATTKRFSKNQLCQNAVSDFCPTEMGTTHLYDLIYQALFLVYGSTSQLWQKVMQEFGYTTCSQTVRFSLCCIRVWNKCRHFINLLLQMPILVKRFFFCCKVYYFWVANVSIFAFCHLCFIRRHYVHTCGCYFSWKQINITK